MSADAAPTRGGADDGDAGAAGNSNEPQAIELSFDPVGTITMKPKASRKLTVRATLADDTTPVRELRIRFALVGNDAADAVLDASDVLTDADGVAQVTLFAPSQPTGFTVRASNPRGQVAQQGVNVIAQGLTDLLVQPSYAGHRPVTSWTATARAGATCAELVGNPPPDGPLPTSADAGAPLKLHEVPVGVDLAITVRAGFYVGGCVNLPALSEAEGNQVLVYASDRPLNLAASNLSLGFGASNAHPAFDKLLQNSVALVESALLGSAKSDVVAVLDGMYEAAPDSSRDAFDAARTEQGWDNALESAFGKSAARRLRDPAQRWLGAGLAALNAPDAFSGRLSPNGNQASFTLGAVASATPENAGVVGPFTVDWSADSNDTVQLSMELSFQPVQLLTALAVAPARAEFDGMPTLERALALALDCAQVAQVLVAAGESPDLTTFDSCDQNCTINLCESAVAAAWAKAKLSSSESASLSLTATGAAQVGDEAQATALSGSWVGQLQTSSGTAPVSGALTASSGH